MPAALIFLSFVPVLGGAFRIGQLTGGAEITPENARFFASPLPLLLHIPSASLYCVLGALQFVPRLRGRGWHRRAGRLLVPTGLLAALSGLWMTQFYPDAPGDGDLLYVLRLLFGTAMAVSIALGFLAVRRRDFARHRAWMIRGYAIGIGAGTQALIQVPVIMIAEPPASVGRALLLGAGWVINLGVAEWFIRRPAMRRTRPVVPPRTELEFQEVR